MMMPSRLPTAIRPLTVVSKFSGLTFTGISTAFSPAAANRGLSACGDFTCAIGLPMMANSRVEPSMIACRAGGLVMMSSWCGAGACGQVRGQRAAWLARQVIGKTHRFGLEQAAVHGPEAGCDA